MHEEQDNAVGQSDDMMIEDDTWGDLLTEYGGTQRSEITDDEDEVISMSISSSYQMKCKLLLGHQAFSSMQ